MKKLDKPVARHIVDYIEDNISALEDPRPRGKALTGSLGELWRYRVGDYRIVCEIQNNIMRVLVLKVGHRKQIYKPT